MSYIGQAALKNSELKRFDVTSSTSATHVLSWTAPNEQSLWITINGVKQQDDAYSISAGSPTTITLTDALIATDKMEVIGIVDIGVITIVGDNTVSTAKLGDNAVTVAKIGNQAVGQTQLTDNAIGQAQLQDNAVGLAEMAGLARGKLIVGDASGDPSALTVGTADQVLLSDGTDASWSDLSTGTSWQAVKTAAFTAVAGEGYPCNTTSAAYTVTLPASASVGDTIELVDYAGTWDTNNVTLDPQSLNMKGSTGDLRLRAEREGVKLVYVDATQGWVAAAAVNETAPALRSLTYPIEYLVVGGGGGGGGSHRGGGGGAGGYRNSYASETSGRNSSTETPWNISDGVVITVTVGAGGVITNPNNGGTGGTSSIVATGQTTVSSYGGGGGGTYQSNATAGTYGSGAGAGQNSSAVQTGSDGTAAQGFDGGDTAATNNYQGGCGGGASEDGDDGGAAVATTGGDGLASLITGSTVTRAGGGGGGSYGATAGYSSGGTGGGGNGGSDDAGDPHSGVSDGSYYYPLAGTVNTGGGGGGTSGNAVSSPYGTGGSGVVILRMTTLDYSGTTTGAPTVFVDATDTVLTFNASGSYTT